MIKKFRVWLLRKLSMGRPIVMNVTVNGLVDLSESDSWGLMADCYIDGGSGHLAITKRKV